MTAAFIAGVAVGAFVTMITMALYVMKPRYDDLIAQRDHWRARAIKAEDSPDQQTDATMGRITGVWGNALDEVE